MKELPYKISTLVYLRNHSGKLLLMERNKSPNKGLWSPIGGKLEMQSGESPHEAAVREVREEVGLEITPADLHLFAMIAEKGYEDQGHWLMFLFDCRKELEELPPAIVEGRFGFFSREEIDNLPVPGTDRQSLWKIYFESRVNFVALRADCHSSRELTVDVDERMLLQPGRTEIG